MILTDEWNEMHKEGATVHLRHYLNDYVNWDKKEKPNSGQQIFSLF
jgi:hypothetical protein